MSDNRRIAVSVYITESQKEELEVLAKSVLQLRRPDFLSNALLAGSELIAIAFQKIPDIPDLSADLAMIGIRSALKMAREQGIDVVNIEVNDSD